MPTGENIEPAGGRVTRSLRKRLTSIDSDVPSRPGTPNNINLQTIPETNTPKKRVTRRASLSTPSTMTPTKESTVTPARRLTRRSSVNFYESDDQTTVQTVSKGPSIAVVKEEECEAETPKEKPKRVLRSSSKSPNDPENTKKGKNSSKKSTNQAEPEEQKEKSVIVLDDSVDENVLKPVSVKKKTRNSIKKENAAETDKSENGSTPTKKSANLSATEKNSKNSPSPDKNDSDKKQSSGMDAVSPVKSASKRDSLRKQTTPEQSDKASGKKNRSAEEEKQLSDVKSSPLFFEKIEPSQESPSNKNLSQIATQTSNRRLSLAKKNQSSPAKDQSAQSIPLKKNLPEPLKNVAFTEVADENTVKNVYPKTPGLIKSKSYILDASNDVDKDETYKSKKDHSFEEKETKSDRENSDEEENEGLNTKTPYKLKLMAVESSTPIQNSSPKHNKSSEIQKQKEKSLKENLMTEEEGVVAFPTSWTKSVSGTVRDTSKIDCIVSENSLQEKKAQETSIKSLSNAFKNSNKKRVDQDDSDDSDMLEEDDEFGDDEENDRNADKTVYLDDEAMEVADGEESMDSEERAYLEENEVPEYGESIGSQDSEDDDQGDEEPDEDDAAFVVSDTEVIEELLSSEDEIEISEKNNLESSNQKKYKRIYQASESSEEEPDTAGNKDDTDFCLLVDSSVEVENIENVKQPGSNKSPMKSLKIEANDSDMKNKSVKEDSKLDNSKIKKTVQEDVSEKENEPEKSTSELLPKILNENAISDMNVAKKSEVKNDADIEINPSKENISKKESKPNQTVQGNDSDTDMEEQECTTATQRNPEIDGVSHTNEQQEEKLTKSPKRKSITTEYLTCNEGLEFSKEKPLSQSRKSIGVPLNAENLNDISMKPLNEMDGSLTESKTPSKTTKKSRKMSTIGDENGGDDLEKNEKEPALQSTQKKNLAKSPNRKSLNITATDKSEGDKQDESDDDTQDERDDKKQLNKSSRKSANKSIVCNDGFESTNEKSLNKSRKSVSGSINASPDKELDVSQRKSIDKSNSNSDEKQNSKGRKSLNESRKSLIRTSTEETNDTVDQCTVDKTELSLEEGSEPEETLSASENPLDSSAGKSLNKSKNSRKSFDRSSLSQNDEPEQSKRRKSIAQQSIIMKNNEISADSEEENEENLPVDFLQNKQEKSKRRKSVAQQNIIMKNNESSADSEEENEENLPVDFLQNKQANEPEKSKRRKSIAQQSIIRKASDSSADSEDNDNDEKSSAEITDNDMESSNGDEAEAEFSDEENVAKNRTTSEFFGEEDKSESSFKHNSSRRKSILTNESKLDETFQLDPKSSLSSSLHDSLHRSILRKSLNQSQKRKESTDADDINDEEDNFSSDSEEDISSKKEEFAIKKKIVSEKGLSVSLNSIQIKKKNLKDTKAIRNSFTIGVSVRKNSSEAEESSEDEAVAENNASSENEDPVDNQDSSSSESKQLNLSEVNCLEKVKDFKHVGPYKSRKSMSNSILPAPPSEGDMNEKKRIKRTSLYLQEEAASNSFVENLAEEKKKINQKKRKSNSFCGVIAPSAEDVDDVSIKEPRSEKKLKKSSESENKEDNLNHVLNRCEEMIEAANEAKLQAKLQAKKVKVKKPKWMDKEEKATKEVEKVEIPLISKKEIKRKEKIKKELAKALKQSAGILTKPIEPVKKVKQKNAPSKLENNNINPTKRLETEFLESLMELSNPTKKRAKEIETTPPSDKENSKKKSNKLKYRIEDIHNKIESDIETLETACGTVIVEPSTPQKLRFQHGFRESPKTPVGFKIQNIDSKNKKTEKKCSRKLKTASGAFIEEDLITSKKNDPSKPKARKRKHLHIEEPTYTLPKTQWTPSGIFVEEDLTNARPLANSTATQFLVASLNSGKKNKEVISSATLNSALSFKKNALQNNKALRQTSREILNVKHRKIVNTKF